MAPGGRRRGGFATFAAAAIALMQVSPKLMILDGYCTGVGVVGFRTSAAAAAAAAAPKGRGFWG